MYFDRCFLGLLAYKDFSFTDQGISSLQLECYYEVVGAKHVGPSHSERVVHLTPLIMSRTIVNRLSMAAKAVIATRDANSSSS